MTLTRQREHLQPEAATVQRLKVETMDGSLMKLPRLQPLKRISAMEKL